MDDTLQSSPRIPDTESPSSGEAWVNRRPIPRWKRALDGIAILLLSPVLVPLMAALAVYIRVVSPGPILFAQERIGHGGRRFRLLKFRTMSAGADVELHARHVARLAASGVPLSKLDRHDPRLLRGAQFLRASGLDELPQLLNVLRGEMSLVGPRPWLEYELPLYPKSALRRFSVAPGLTGLWQVSGKNRTTPKEMIRLDLCYVDRVGPFLDLIILARTPLVLVAQISRTLVATALRWLQPKPATLPSLTP